MKTTKFNLLILSLVSITIACFSCRNNQSPMDEYLTTEKENIKNDIVLIFKNMPNNSRLTHSNGGTYNKGVYEISYSLNGYQNVFWAPKNYSTKSDTLIIKDVESNLEINHKYKVLDELSYIFNPGDTVMFNYHGNVPVVDIKNRETKKFDYNFEALIKQKTPQNSIPHYIQLFNLSYIEVVNMLDGLFVPIDQLKKDLSEKGKNELLKQRETLDSLYSIKNVSDKIYIHYSTKIAYQQRQVGLINGIFRPRSLQVENDSILKYSFFKKYLGQYLKYKYYESDKIKLKKSQVPDYRLIYDSILSNKQLTKGIKKHLLYRNMINIINQSSAKDIKYYFDRYVKSNFSDSLTISFFKSEYNIGQEIADDLVLIANDGNEKSFKDLLEKHKGKTIYIDFWASWCKPCRVAMPSSRILRNELKNEEVVFIYLAYNDQFTKWVNASKKELLSDYSESYFIKNSKSTNFIENHKIYNLPRYMIYDKNGNVKFSNAPSPSSSRVKSAITD